MAVDNIYEYKYYIDGEKLAILQARSSVTYVPYQTGDVVYVTPEVADSSAIFVRYTVARSTTSLTDENSDMGLTKHLSLGIVHYVKARLAEERGDLRMQNYHRGRFLYYVQRDRSNRLGSGARRGMVDKLASVT